MSARFRIEDHQQATAFGLDHRVGKRLHARRPRGFQKNATWGLIAATRSARDATTPSENAPHAAGELPTVHAVFDTAGRDPGADQGRRQDDEPTARTRAAKRSPNEITSSG